MRKTPGGPVKNTDFPKEVLFEPVEIRGEWLKIRWKGMDSKTQGNTRDNFGWIMWKKAEILLIDIFYLD